MDFALIIKPLDNSLSIRIRTLTPLWTGGVDGTMDRIHETGILGSLRWWYEAIVRGLGGSACDPTEHTCELSGERLKRYEFARRAGKNWWEALDEAGICDACKVFGTTGWKRRFKLEVVEDNTKWIWEPTDNFGHVKTLNIRPPNRNRGWFLPPGKMGVLTLKLKGDPEVVGLMAWLLLFLEKWGHIGAKPQLGYGVFQIENRNEILQKAQEWNWQRIKKKTTQKTTNQPVERKGQNLPNLRQFGFLLYRITHPHPAWWTRVPGIERVASKVQPLIRDYSTVPVSPALKNEWRFNQWRGQKRYAFEIFGTLRPNRQRSKVAVSWAYRIDKNTWEIRGWVWLASLRWAEDAWRIVSDEDIWRRVLRVDGQLETFQPNDRDRILQVLQEVLA